MIPPFRWVGGKRRSAARIIEALGPIKGRYIEPFCGSAAVFFALERTGPSLLSDSTPIIIDVLSTIRSHPIEIEGAMMWFRERQIRDGHVEFYHLARAELNRCLTEGRTGPTTVALFLVLSQISFNGLWRVNRTGLYNVPMGTKGKDKTPYDIRRYDLTPWAKALEDAQLYCRDFGSITAREGDVVYCDPPFFGTFDSYTKDSFGVAGHERLVEWAYEQRRRGARIVISGSDSVDTHAIYGHDTKVVRIPIQSTVGASARRKIHEVLYIYD